VISSVCRVCLCACVSVCLSDRIFPEPHALVAHCRGSVLLRQGDEIPRGRGNVGVFAPIDNELHVTRSLQITSCSNRTDHPVAAGRGVVAMGVHSAVVEVHNAGEV